MAENVRRPLKRHGRDTTSLILGLLLLAGGVLFLIADTTDASIDARWSGPVVLVVIGLSGLLSALRPGTRGEHDSPDPR